MIRLASQWWHSAAVAALVAFTGSQVQANGPFGNHGGHAARPAQHHGGSGMNHARPPVHQPTQNFGNAFNNGRHQAQPHGQAVTNHPNHVPHRPHPQPHHPVVKPIHVPQPATKHTNVAIHQGTKQRPPVIHSPIHHPVHPHKKTGSLGNQASTKPKVIEHHPAKSHRKINSAEGSAKTGAKPVGHPQVHGKQTGGDKKHVLKKVSSKDGASAKNTVRPPLNSTRDKKTSAKNLQFAGTPSTRNAQQDVKNGLAIAGAIIDVFAVAAQEGQGANSAVSQGPAAICFSGNNASSHCASSGDTQPGTCSNTFPFGNAVEDEPEMTNCRSESADSVSTCSPAFDFGSGSSSESTNLVPDEEVASDVPAILEYVVQNLTEEPVTYSLQVGGKQWGTYTLAAGETHNYAIPQEEIEVQYVNAEGEQALSIPGDHVYAFADSDGLVELCSADSEDESDDAEQ
jgi:hypothetical protein